MCSIDKIVEIRRRDSWLNRWAVSLTSSIFVTLLIGGGFDAQAAEKSKSSQLVSTPATVPNADSKVGQTKPSKNINSKAKVARGEKSLGRKRTVEELPGGEGTRWSGICHLQMRIPKRAEIPNPS